MVALIPLCSLVYGAVFLHEKATWRQVVFSVLSVAGVIVLAVYATGIGAGSFLGFLILLGTVCRRGLHSGLPRVLGQLHSL